MSEMPNRLVVNVTQIDINRGNKTAFESCAIVACLNRKYPVLTKPMITDRFIAVSDPTTRTRYTWPTPAKVVAWIQDWDSGDERPVRFSLDVNEAFVKPMQNRTVEQKYADRERAKQRKAKREQAIKQETQVDQVQRQEQRVQQRKRIRRGGNVA